MAYCASRYRTVRRRTTEVLVGSVGVGGANPVRIQSMTTSDTQDVAATVRQAVALAEVGCEIVRVTAPNVQAARCLKDIRAGLSAAGFAGVPLVADIHFLPQAAMEAVEHVEKVRVNPGNYADKKKFAVREYDDAGYERELQRLHEAFSPLVIRCRELGRSLRIGTNHGSLSDRIMNRYGDTPLGMVESALEFLRISESHGFRSLILSMKASNPKIMIEAYRLLVGRMDAEGMSYPLHLGVTEAGDGEDGRIKSAIGIGSLLLDGLGDTIRVSLTEDSVHEVPVARAIAEKAMSLWDPSGAPDGAATDSIDPYHFVRRAAARLDLGSAPTGPDQPPRVIVPLASATALPEAFVRLAAADLKENRAEGILVPAAGPDELRAVAHALAGVPEGGWLPAFVGIEAGPALAAADLAVLAGPARSRIVVLRAFGPGAAEDLRAWAAACRGHGHFLAIDAGAASVRALAPVLRGLRPEEFIFTLGSLPALRAPGAHPTGAYRALLEELRALGADAPLWIRATAATAIRPAPDFLGRLLDASFLAGSLLCDGAGDLLSIETDRDPVRSVRLAYNVLQGAGARISKTEFVACPSCGRTLFDLQDTTRRIRARTGHLKGVKIAIMGCIVNGPGEMADADFGYVGGAPGKINLYVGKQCVRYNVPQDEADSRLVDLIREHGKWFDPDPASA